jgi:para-nitrobenzyl esterase
MREPRMRVDTDAGALRGIADNGVVRFLGVPFAAPSTGAMRFRRPQPIEPWRGVRDALMRASGAPQPRTFGAGMRGADATADDCLYLNVFAPTSAGTRRPVFVWIHGGGYLHGEGGDALFDGGRLALAQDCIVVSLNYRLGLWGFAPFVDRNVGLADQIAALEWVARNALSLGGDPANVTVIGESSGAMSVCNLLASPAARSLFHRAIAQSGAADHVGTRAQADEAAAVARDELRGDPHDASVDALLAAQRATLRRLRPSYHTNPLRPHVDDDLLPRHPLAAAESSADIPLIIGMNRDEYRLYVRPSLKIADADLRAFFERRLAERYVADVDAVAARLLHHYRAERPLDRRNPNATIVADVETELRFRDPMLRYALARGRNTWLYQFDWPSPALRGWLGATHAVEIPFVFGNFDVPGIAKFAGGGPDASALSRDMMQLWGAFARDGRPPSIWRPFDANDRTQLHLDREIASRRMNDDPTVALWDEILLR